MKLNKLQLKFSEALLYKNSLIENEIREKKALSSHDLLQVYRNNFVMGVTEALAVTYRYTLALVGEAFFNTAARQYILQQPPQENNIINYGDGFSDYLHTLAQLQSMPYIAEMAGFEWLLEQTSNLQIETKKLDINRLAAVPEQQFAEILFQVPSQVNLFSSEQDIWQLYQMLINNSVQETDIAHCCYIALKKQPDFTVELIKLNKDEFSLLQQISKQRALGEIAANDLHQFLPSLVEKELINGFTSKVNL